MPFPTTKSEIKKDHFNLGTFRIRVIFFFAQFSITLEDGILKKYLDAARELSPEERGKLLEGDSAFTDAHQTLAQEEPSENNADGENHHFIALIEKDGELYELDGRKSHPIKHGATTKENFLEVYLCANRNSLTIQQ